MRNDTLDCGLLGAVLVDLVMCSSESVHEQVVMRLILRTSKLFLWTLLLQSLFVVSSINLRMDEIVTLAMLP